MATIDKTGCGPLLGTIPLQGITKVYVMDRIIDLTGAVQGDDATVYQCLPIPADTLVMNVKVEIITPATGTTCTFGFGDGGSTAGWDTAVDMKGTAGTITHSIIGTDARAVAASQGYFYDTADSIDALIEAGTTQDGLGPKFKISALCVQY